MKATLYMYWAVFFLWYCTLYKVILTRADEILKFDHSTESQWEVLSFGNVYCAVQDVSNLLVWGGDPKL